MGNSALLSIHRMQRGTANSSHSLGLVLVIVQKATSVPKLPKWTPDTACPAPQPRVLEMVGQNHLNLNPKEALSPGTTGAYPNSSDTWRPAAVNTSHMHKLYISIGFQLKSEQFSSLHSPPIG